MRPENPEEILERLKRYVAQQPAHESTDTEREEPVRAAGPAASDVPPAEQLPAVVDDLLPRKQ